MYSIDGGDLPEPGRSVRMRPVTRILPWLVALAPSIAVAQVLPGELARSSLQAQLWEYRDVIREYRRGGGDAVERVLLWEKKHLDRVHGAIDTDADESRPWEAVFLRAGAMLHTDVALRLLQRAEGDQAMLHVDAAGRLLQKAGQDSDAYAGRWSFAVARLLRALDRLPEAERFLETSRSRWPRNPAVLFESGALEELLAGDVTVPVVIELTDRGGSPQTLPSQAAGTTTPLSRKDVEELRRRRVTHLEKAARWLQQAVDADPSNADARLRLGRVRTLRNEHDAALTLLHGAAASDDRDVAYLARLFTAALHERQNRLDAAAAAYRAAIEHAPSSHAAYVGLSAALRRSGREDEARDVLSRVVDGAVRNRRDPWWSYLREAAGVSLARFSDLRREVRQ